MNEQTAPVVITNLAINHFQYYAWAAHHGHVKLLKYLETRVPGEIQNMIKMEDFEPYQLAAQNGHLEVCNHILSQSSACFAYAEEHQHEYGAIITPLCR